MRKLIIIILSFFPLIGFAKSEYINLECPTYDVGDTIECKIYTNVNFAIKAIEYEINLPKQLELVSFSKDDMWQGEMVGSKLYLYTDENKIGKVLLGNIKIHILENISNIDINSINLVYTDENYNDKKIDVNSVEIIDVKKNDNNKYVIIIIGLVLIIGSVLLVLMIRRRRV